MKKIVFLLTMLVASIAHATQTVQVVWPFNIGASHAQMVRTLLDNSNKSQSKYQFVLINKPGAGGIIAVNYVQTNDTLTVLAMSTAFFTTPLGTTNKSYDVDNFKIAAHICAKRPMAIMSKNLKSLTEKKEITVGDPGGNSTFIAKTLEKNIKNTTSFLYVPYKGSVEATTDMIGGHLDVSIDWLSHADRLEGIPGAKVLGITGNRTINQHKPVKGLEDFEFDLFLFVPVTVNDDIRKELNAIFNSNNNGATVTFCESDHGVLTTTPFSNLNAMHFENKRRWERLSNIK
jgi:tripartite-type tricarboxylate transporter receptor subunit TctC